MNNDLVKIGIFGCSGRMGRNLLKEVLETEGCILSGGLEHSKSSFLGVDIGELIGQDKIGIAVNDDIENFVGESDVIIDFSNPSATLNLAEVAARQKTALVIGTTGFSGDQQGELESFARSTPIVAAYNMSVGVNTLLGLVEKVAATLDDSYDIEILEMHHNKKIDSPSGTAISLGKAAADGREVALSDVSRKTREGIIGERPRGEIGFATLRGGDVIGDHTVIFAGNGDRIELTHKASNRTIYASGAVRAAKWVTQQDVKLYSMKEVLGI